MTAVATFEFTCAVCGGVSPPSAATSTSTHEPPDFDTRPGADLRFTIGNWVLECPHCGYAAPDVREAVTEAVAIVRANDYQTLRRDDAIPRAASRFLRYALLLEKLAEFAAAGWSCLHAAWSCDDAGDDAAARRCRAEALRLWRHGKLHGQPFLGDHAQEFALVTDVLRRLGEFDEAKQSCLEGLNLDELPPLIDDLLRMQLTLIQRRDTACHSMSEILDRPEGGKRVVLY